MDWANRRMSSAPLATGSLGCGYGNLRFAEYCLAMSSSRYAGAATPTMSRQSMSVEYWFHAALAKFPDCFMLVHVTDVPPDDDGETESTKSHNPSWCVYCPPSTQQTKSLPMGDHSGSSVTANGAATRVRASNNWNAEPGRAAGSLTAVSHSKTGTIHSASRARVNVSLATVLASVSVVNSVVTPSRLVPYAVMAGSS